MKALRILSLAAALLTLCTPCAGLAQKVSDLPAATSADTADLVSIVDVSDTTVAATGRNKRITLGNFSLSLPTLNASALSTGTVPTLRLAAPLQSIIGNSGTLDLGSVTLTLPADVTRLGSSIDLASEVTGNLPVSRLNSGTSASASTYWRGDGTWATVSGGGGSPAGSGTELQYRSGTSFGAIAGSSWDGTTLTLPILDVSTGLSCGNMITANNYIHANNFIASATGFSFDGGARLVPDVDGFIEIRNNAQTLGARLGVAASNVVALRNGTIAQQLQISSTYTDDSNLRYGSISFSGNDLVLANVAAGSASKGDIRIVSQSGHGIILADEFQDRWKMTSGGNIVPLQDNVFDFGADSSLRPRQVWAATGVYGGLEIGAGVGGNGIFIRKNGQGVAALTDGTGSDFNRISLGGNTDSYPAIKRAGSDIEIVKGDGTQADTAIILSSPNGTRYKITVGNAGNLTTTAL